MPPQQGGQCPFCQLINNPEQLMVVGETDNFYAWLEVNPRAKGHTMIVPKEHVENVLEFSMEEWTEAFKLTREVVEKAKKGLEADGASITVNIEESGGQMLPHAYIQVFPRFEDDENAGTPTGAIFPQQEELQSQLDGIQDSMSGVSVDLGDTREAHPESQNFKDESEIDNMLSGSQVGGELSMDEEEKRQEVRDDNPRTEDANDKNTEAVKNEESETMSSQAMLSELVNRFGGIEEFLESEEFQSYLRQTNMRVEAKRQFSGDQSIDWR